MVLLDPIIMQFGMFMLFVVNGLIEVPLGKAAKDPQMKTLDLIRFSEK